jgi:uncharacterized MAPEG superfamily protein
MQFAVWMVFLAATLPYLAVGLAKSTMRYDNAAPRLYLSKLQGWRARADWAQRNHFEAFPPFAAGVILAEIAHAPQPSINHAAAAFVLIRLFYTAVYLAGFATLRTLVFAAGVYCVIRLFELAATS